MIFIDLHYSSLEAVVYIRFFQNDALLSFLLIRALPLNYHSTLEFLEELPNVDMAWYHDLELTHEKEHALPYSLLHYLQ